MEGTTTGTPGYMAPEVVLGEAQVDGRADVYALGCVAYFLLTGALVFDDPNPMSMALKHVQTPPDPPSRRTELPIPADLDRLVMRCLAKKPDDRPSGARSSRPFSRRAPSGVDRRGRRSVVGAPPADDLLAPVACADSDDHGPGCAEDLRRSAMSARALPLLAMATAGVMLGHQVAGKAVRDSMFLSSWPVAALPTIVIARPWWRSWPFRSTRVS